MTEDNRKLNLADEIDRATQAASAAEALLGLGLFADSVSRSFYVVHHYLRALLLSRGLEAKTHAGGIHVFNTQFVRAGLMPSSFNRTLAGLQRSRELADYDAAVRFEAADARALLDDALAFGSAVVDLLRREGAVA